MVIPHADPQSALSQKNVGDKQHAETNQYTIPALCAEFIQPCR
jgi:hypothetical protein